MDNDIITTEASPTARIEALIERIGAASVPGEVTNEMVAEILNSVYLYASSARTSASESATGVAQAQSLIASLRRELEAAVGANLTDRIDSLNEALRFLEGVSDKNRLLSMLGELRDGLTRTDARIPVLEVLSESGYQQLELAGEVRPDVFYFTYEDD